MWRVNRYASPEVLIVAGIALYRPGPVASLHHNRRLHDDEAVEYSTRSSSPS